MKYKSLLLVLLLGLACQAFALDKAQLTDTLNAIAVRHAYVGAIKVSQVKVWRGGVDVYTNATLSWLSMSPELVDTLYQVTRELTDTKGQVRIYTDGHEIQELVTSIHGKKNSKPVALPKVTPLTKNVSRPYTASKGLEGRHIAVYGSHGLYFHQAQERWMWQRARMFTTVEDLYTTSYVMPFLVPMLENAGAVVIQARERDRQTHEVIVDDKDANQGSWVNVVDGGWGEIPDGVLYEGENPFTMGGYAYQNCKDNGNNLRYTPTLPEGGEYAVYVSYKTVENSTEDAQYVVKHKGIETLFSINQKMGGSTWVYLGTFDFSTDQANNYVEVLQKGKNGKVVTSDAVRWGGGMGCVARFAQEEIWENIPSAKENGKQNAKANKKKGEEERPKLTREQVADYAETSGVPRWIEGSRYWQQYSGIPDSVYNYTEGKNDYTDDYASRGRWMNYVAGGSAAYPDGPGLGIPLELGLAFHTDAGTTPDDEIIGTLLIYTEYDNDKNKQFPCGASRMLNRDYADYMQTQMVEDIQRTFAPEWHRRRLHNSSYAESRNPKIPTVLLEFLSHQNFADMKYGLDPTFRFVASRAIYKAMLKFNHEQYGTPYVVQPLPVENFAIRFAEGKKVRLSWAERVDSLEATAKPTAYVLYTRKAGQDWDNGVVVKDTATTITLETDVQYDFKVCALNEGGISFPSEVLTAHKASQEKGRVLIVNNFTRIAAPDHFESKDSLFGGFIAGHYGVGYMNEVNYIGEQFEFDRTLPWVSDDHCGFGASYNDGRCISPRGNSFDYPVMHGKVLAEMGYSFVSTSVGAVRSFEGDWTMVDIICGKQKTTSLGTQKVLTRYSVLPDNLKKALEEYKGKLLFAGSYIGTDLKDKKQQEWTSNVLHYKFAADNASRSGEIYLQKRYMKGDAHLETDVNETITPCETPDGIYPTTPIVGDKVTSVKDNKQILSYTAARYADSGISAGVAYDGNDGQRQLIFGFMLESLKDFDTFYKNAIEWLTK